MKLKSVKDQITTLRTIPFLGAMKLVYIHSVQYRIRELTWHQVGEQIRNEINEKLT